MSAIYERERWLNCGGDVEGVVMLRKWQWGYLYIEKEIKICVACDSRSFELYAIPSKKTCGDVGNFIEQCDRVPKINGA